MPEAPARSAANPAVAGSFLGGFGKYWASFGPLVGVPGSPGSLVAPAAVGFEEMGCPGAAVR